MLLINCLPLYEIRASSETNVFSLEGKSNAMPLRTCQKTTLEWKAE